MNKNILIALVLVFALLGFVGVAKAKDGSDDRKSYSSSDQEMKSDGSSDDLDDSDSDLEIETENRLSRSDDSISDKSDDDDSDNKDGVGEEHRSTVADVVLKLKEVADKDKKIGEEVKKVAEEQSESAKKSTEAIKEIEKRSGWKVFFVGTDYKNLGGLRSEMVTTDNNIDRLTKALEKATDPAVKAQLDLEIKALQAEKLKVDTFIDDNEGKFSLFGWLVKLFN